MRSLIAILILASALFVGACNSTGSSTAPTVAPVTTAEPATSAEPSMEEPSASPS